MSGQGVAQEIVDEIDERSHPDQSRNNRATKNHYGGGDQRRRNEQEVPRVVSDELDCAHPGLLPVLDWEEESPHTGDGEKGDDWEAEPQWPPVSFSVVHVVQSGGQRLASKDRLQVVVDRHSPIQDVLYTPRNRAHQEVAEVPVDIEVNEQLGDGSAQS